MAKFFKIFVSAFLSMGIIFSIFPAVTSSASLLDSSQSCTMRIKSGWSLVSLAELACGAFKFDSNRGGITNFPAYLDIYGYDGSEYIYARITKQEMENGGMGSRSLELAAEKYLNKIVQKISSGQFSNYSDFERSIEREIEQNSASKIKEYAGRLVKELFTSVWVYNPGRDFSVEYSSGSGSEEDSLAILTIRALITDTNSSDLLDYIETQVLPLALGELERSGGYSSFFKEMVSGKVILDSGWNFLSYSRLLSDNSGNLNFGSGNCNITKAYLFDNNSKKWVSSQNAGRSMIGSGIVVYNSGTKCNLAPENSIISRMKSMLRGGADNLPPVLPN